MKKDFIEWFNWVLESLKDSWKNINVVWKLVDNTCFSVFNSIWNTNELQENISENDLESAKELCLYVKENVWVIKEKNELKCQEKTILDIALWYYIDIRLKKIWYHKNSWLKKSILNNLNFETIVDLSNEDIQNIINQYEKIQDSKKELKNVNEKWWYWIEANEIEWWEEKEKLIKEYSEEIKELMLKKEELERKIFELEKKKWEQEYNLNWERIKKFEDRKNNMEAMIENDYKLLNNLFLSINNRS